MDKGFLFKSLTIDELVNFLEQLPLDYEVLLYDMDKPVIGREFTLKVFEDEKMVEVY